MTSIKEIEARVMRRDKQLSDVADFQVESDRRWLLAQLKEAVADAEKLRAKLAEAVEAEREACAEVADLYDGGCDCWIHTGIAEKIRARSQHPKEGNEHD